MQVKLLLPLRSVLTFPLASKAITVAFFAIDSGAADRALAIISSSVLGDANSPLTTSWPIPRLEKLSSIIVPRTVALRGMRMRPSHCWCYRQECRTSSKTQPARPEATHSCEKISPMIEQPMDLLAVRHHSFLEIADVVNTDNVVVRIANGFIAGIIRLTQNRDFSIERFALGNGGDSLSLWIENRANGP